MKRDPASVAAAMDALAGPPPPCQCPCSSYGHPPCNQAAADRLDTPPSVFGDRASDPTQVCRNCAEARAALRSSNGVTLTIRFPASTDQRFTVDALAHLVGKEINLLVSPQQKITGTVSAAVVIEDGHAAQLTINDARLFQAILTPAPEGPHVPPVPDPDRRSDDQTVWGAGSTT